MTALPRPTRVQSLSPPAMQLAVHLHFDRPRLPLTLVSAVCSARVIPQALVSAISGFVTLRSWTIITACKHGSLQLLQDVIAIEAPHMHPLYRAHVFEQALVSAVRHGNVMDLVQCLCAFCPSGFTGEGMAEAARLGKVQVMEWLATNHSKVIWSSIYADRAAAAGNLNVLQWLKKHSDNADRYLAGAIEHAAHTGRSQIVSWLYENIAYDAVSAENEAYAVSSAIETRDLEMLKHLQKLRQNKIQWEPGDYNYATPIDMATPTRDLELIKWLYENVHRGFDDQRATSDAASSGSTDVVRWLLEHSPRGHTYDGAFLEAVKNGHLETAQMLRPFRSPVDCYPEAIQGAALNGHLGVVQWLFCKLRIGCMFSREAEQDAVSQAAGNGHFELVKWLHAQLIGGGRPRYDTSEAAAHNHFEIVKWLVANSDPENDANDLNFAVESGNLEMVIWLQENTNVSCSILAMECTASLNQLELLKWLHENRTEGCSADGMDSAAMYDHLEIVKWLHENRTEGCTTNAIDRAPSLTIVKWLHENRTEGCTTEAMDRVAANGDVDTLLFLYANRTEGCTTTAAVDALIEGHMAIFEWLLQTYPGVIKLQKIRNQLVYLLPDFMPPVLEKLDRTKRRRSS